MVTREEEEEGLTQASIIKPAEPYTNHLQHFCVSVLNGSAEELMGW